MNEEQCTIDFGDGNLIKGVCDPSQYEHRGPNFGKGYDPEWISCFYPDQNYDKHGTYIYCFHPTQGHENGPFYPCEKEGCNAQIEIPAPKELPKTGMNQIAYIGIAGMITCFVLAYLLKRSMNGKTENRQAE